MSSRDTTPNETKVLIVNTDSTYMTLHIEKVYPHWNRVERFEMEKHRKHLSKEMFVYPHWYWAETFEMEKHLNI